MKKIFLSVLLIAFVAAPSFASNGGGKKKAKKKAKIECKMDKCDPKDCEPRNCDPNCCDYKVCPKEEKKCAEATACSGS